MSDYIDREEERVMDEYIERKRIEKFFDGIYDCADLTFEPNDHCCAADDCAHCKWHETMNAIKKRILSIPAADVRPVVHCKDCGHWNGKHQQTAKWSGDKVAMCAWWSRSYGTIQTANMDYCSYGYKEVGA